MVLVLSVLHVPPPTPLFSLSKFVLKTSFLPCQDLTQRWSIHPKRFLPLCWKTVPVLIPCLGKLCHSSLSTCTFSSFQTLLKNRLSSLLPFDCQYVVFWSRCTNVLPSYLCNLCSYSFQESGEIVSVVVDIKLLDTSDRVRYRTRIL